MFSRIQLNKNLDFENREWVQTNYWYIYGDL